MRRGGSGEPGGGLRLGWKAALLVSLVLALVLGVNAQGAKQAGVTFVVDSTTESTTILGSAPEDPSFPGANEFFITGTSDADTISGVPHDGVC